MTIISLMRDLHTPDSTLVFKISSTEHRWSGGILPSVYDSSAKYPYPMTFSNGLTWIELNYTVTELYKGL